MSTAVSGTSADPLAAYRQSSAQKSAAPATGTAESFLTMLVTQMKNQDPMNPMDNAQITSQMAQINTVTGLEKVNASIKSLSTQMQALQALQGVSLVGHDVTLPGNDLAVADGKGRGVVQLASAASAVTVQVLSSTGQVVGTVDLGASGAGNHTFEWPMGKNDPAQEYTFRVSATNGKTAVTAGTLMLDRVQAVSAGSDGLQLSLARSGTVAASDVLAYN